MMNKFNEKFKEMRLEKGLTQKQLAQELGFGRTTISDWEIGANEPSFDTLIKISKFFETTPNYMLGLEDF